MPRIIVTTDPSPLPAGVPVWLDEHVQSVHLSTDHAAAQFHRAGRLGDQRCGGRRRPAGRSSRASRAAAAREQLCHELPQPSPRARLEQRASLRTD